MVAYGKPLIMYSQPISLATAQAEHQVKSGLFLDVVIRKGAAILELLAREDEPLLVRRDALLILDLGLNVFDSVRGLNIKSDGLASQRLDEDLHTSTEAENQVQGRLLLDVVVAESPAVLELLTSEDQALLVGGNTLLVLNLSLDVLDRVGSLDVESDSLAGESLNEDLHVLFLIIIEIRPPFIIFEFNNAYIK